MCHTPHDAPAEQRRYSECTAAGECVCTGEYAKPVPEVYAGGEQRAGVGVVVCQWVVGWQKGKGMCGVLEKWEWEAGAGPAHHIMQPSVPDLNKPGSTPHPSACRSGTPAAGAM